jgi:hypothetical protein
MEVIPPSEIGFLIGLSIGITWLCWAYISKLLTWICSKPTILPSLSILVLPFIFACLFDSISILLNNIESSKNQSIVIEVIQKIFPTLIGSLTGGLIGFLSSYIAWKREKNYSHKENEQKTIKLIIIGMEGHLKELLSLKENWDTNDRMNGFMNASSRVSGIEDNLFYKQGLINIGILSARHIELVTLYFESLNSVLDDIRTYYKPEYQITSTSGNSNTGNANTALEGHIKRQIDVMQFCGRTIELILSLEVLRDDEKYEQLKVALENDYRNVRNTIGRGSLNESIYSWIINSDFFSLLPLIRKMLLELGILDDLEKNYLSLRRE